MCIIIENYKAFISLDLLEFVKLAMETDMKLKWTKRGDSWGVACRWRQLSALQTMEMPLDGAKYDWLLNLQTLEFSRKIVYCCFGTLIHVLPWRQQNHQCLCFHYWDFSTNFWRNNWRHVWGCRKTRLSLLFMVLFLTNLHVVLWDFRMGKLRIYKL